MTSKPANIGSLLGPPLRRHFFSTFRPFQPAPPGPPTTFAPANIQPDLGFPFPDANTAGATEQTFRTIVKPDLWGNKMRFRFSNVFGTQAVTFSSVTVALQEYSGNLVEGTVTPVTFSSKKSATIPAGQKSSATASDCPGYRVPTIQQYKGATWLSATPSKATAGR